MPTIKVNISRLSQYESEMQDILSRVNSITNQFNSLSRNLDWDIKAESNINSRLSGISRELSAELSGINGMKHYLGTARAKYVEVESKNSAEIQAGTSNSYGTNTSISGISVKYWKEYAKLQLDALGEFGDFGDAASLPIALWKIIIDNDGITEKDIWSIIEGSGNSFIGVSKIYSKVTGKSLSGKYGKEELFGLATENVDDTVKKGTKAAGWALSLVANGFSNYEEYNKGEITAERAAKETITETVIDIGKGAAITAGVAAGCAALGVAAPAVVVSVAGMAVSCVADLVCENLTGKSVTEFASDTILDAAEFAEKSITEANKIAGNAVSGWFSKLTSGGGNLPQYAGT